MHRLRDVRSDDGDAEDEFRKICSVLLSVSVKSCSNLVCNDEMKEVTTGTPRKKCTKVYGARVLTLLCVLSLFIEVLVSVAFVACLRYLSTITLT